MAIRKRFFLSLAAASAAHLSLVSAAVAQQPTRATSPEEIAAGVPAEFAGGLITSANDFQLAPGEMIVSGDPGLGIESNSAHGLAFDGVVYPEGIHPESIHPGAMHPEAIAPEMMHGHPPLPYGYEHGSDCPSCDSHHYVFAEALYFRHDGDGSLRRSNIFNVGEDELDYEWAGRLTIGRRFDCVNGYEASYAGPLEWEDTAPSERWEAKLNSLEFNRNYFGWDVVKAFIGIRTLLYDEELIDNDFDFFPAADDFASQHTDNFLIGPQIGIELYYPLADRVFLSSKVKGAVLANFYESDTRVFFSVDPGDPVPLSAADNISVSDDDIELAGFAEIGTGLRYQATECITATVGYELWYLGGVATAYDRAINFGSGLEADEDVIVHGATAGVEFSF